MFVVYGDVVVQPPTHFKMSSNMKVILGTMEIGRRKLVEDAPVRQTQHAQCNFISICSALRYLVHSFLKEAMKLTLLSC